MQLKTASYWRIALPIMCQIILSYRKCMRPKKCKPSMLTKAIFRCFCIWPSWEACIFCYLPHAIFMLHCALGIDVWLWRYFCLKKVLCSVICLPSNLFEVCSIRWSYISKYEMYICILCQALVFTLWIWCGRGRVWYIILWWCSAKLQLKMVKIHSCVCFRY